MTILNYHDVHPNWQSPLAVTPQRFAGHCLWLARHREVITAEQAAARWSTAGRLPGHTVAVTFDDGFAGLFDHAFPILTRHRMASTVFLVSATLTAQRVVDWLDHPPTPPPKTLALEQVREMREAGIQFGSHTHTHPNLTSLSEEECERDLRTSKEVLEDLLGTPVVLLAYPRGLHNRRVQEVARRVGFSYAFATSKQLEPAGPFAVPRTGIYGGDGVAALAVKSTRLFPTFKRMTSPKLRQWARRRDPY